MKKHITKSVRAITVLSLIAMLFGPNCAEAMHRRNDPHHQPIQTWPVQTQPVQAQPTQARRTQAHPVQAQPIQTWPVQARRVQAHPVQAAQPTQAHPVQAAQLITFQEGTGYKVSIVHSGPEAQLGKLIETRVNEFMGNNAGKTETFIDMPRYSDAGLTNLLNNGKDGSKVQVNISQINDLENPAERQKWDGLLLLCYKRRDELRRMRRLYRYYSNVDENIHVDWNIHIVENPTEGIADTHKKRIIMHSIPSSDAKPQQWLIINGSANLSYSALTRNHEISFVLEVSDFARAPDEIKSYCLRNLLDHYYDHGVKHPEQKPLFRGHIKGTDGKDLLANRPFSECRPLEAIFSNGGAKIKGGDQASIKSYLKNLIEDELYTEFHLAAMTFSFDKIKDAIKKRQNETNARFHILCDGMTDREETFATLEHFRQPGIDADKPLWHGKMVLARGADTTIPPVCIIMSANLTFDCLGNRQYANAATVVTDNWTLYRAMVNMFLSKCEEPRNIPDWVENAIDDTNSQEKREALKLIKIASAFANESKTAYDKRIRTNALDKARKLICPNMDEGDMTLAIASYGEKEERLLWLSQVKAALQETLPPARRYRGPRLGLRM